MASSATAERPTDTRGRSEFPAPKPENRVQTRERRYRLGLYASGIMILGLGIGAALLAKDAANNRREAKNAEIEGNLRGLGFDRNRVPIDIHGDQNLLTLDCQEATGTSSSLDKHVTLFFEESSMTAFVRVKDEEDQLLRSDPYKIGTGDAIDGFAEGDFRDMCTSIKS